MTTQLTVGQRITAGEGEDRDSGIVQAIDGDQITVGWDSGVSTTQSREALGLPATPILPDELAAEARATGATWGQQEADLWRDQHEGKELPEWTMGTYQGMLPRTLNDEQRGAYETILDCAARDAWEASR